MLREPPPKQTVMTEKEREEEKENCGYGDMNMKHCQTLHPSKDWMLEELNYTLLRP